MEDFLELLSEANKAFKTADHLTYVTYPLVQETKLLIAIVENLYSALIKSIEAILEYDQLYKRISLLPQDPQLRFEIFKTKSAKRYNIDDIDLDLIEDLREIISYHKKSPLEFVRKDKYVLYLNNLRIKTIDFKKIKEDLEKVNTFLKKVNLIFEDERKYQRS
ncbi:hypothetical protein CL621_03480 [archaeon]|nr:hypothetical protein [archaeon]